MFWGLISGITPLVPSSGHLIVFKSSTYLLIIHFWTKRSTKVCWFSGVSTTKGTVHYQLWGFLGLFGAFWGSGQFLLYPQKAPKSPMLPPPVCFDKLSNFVGGLKRTGICKFICAVITSRSSRSFTFCVNHEKLDGVVAIERNLCNLAIVCIFEVGSS